MKRLCALLTRHCSGDLLRRAVPRLALFRSERHHRVVAGMSFSAVLRARTRPQTHVPRHEEVSLRSQFLPVASLDLPVSGQVLEALVWNDPRS